MFSHYVYGISLKGAQRYTVAGLMLDAPLLCVFLFGSLWGRRAEQSAPALCNEYQFNQAKVIVKKIKVVKWASGTGKVERGTATDDVKRGGVASQSHSSLFCFIPNEVVSIIAIL